MKPIGDKVVLIKSDVTPPDHGGIILSSVSCVLCKAIAVGEGMPYGRGEFYAPTVKEGELVYVAEATWNGAPPVHLHKGEKRATEHRVVHEREILMTIKEEEL